MDYFVEITTKCNLKCPFCYNNGTQNKSKMDKGTFLILVSKLSSADRIIFTGGEPLTHQHFFEFVEICKQGGIKYSLSTNALLLNRRWSELLNYPPENIHISLDGIGKIHDRIRLCNGLFKEIDDFLLKLEETGISTRVFVQMSIGKENQKEVQSVLDYLSNFNCIKEVKIAPYYQIKSESLFKYIYSFKEGKYITSEVITGNEFYQYILDIVKGFLILIPLTILIIKNSNGLHQLIALYFVHIFLNIADAFFEPASRAIIPNVVEKEDLTKAWAVFSFIDNFQYAIAMLCVGLVYTKVGILGILLIDAFTFLSSAFFNAKVELIATSEKIEKKIQKVKEKEVKLKWLFEEKRVFYSLVVSTLLAFFSISLGNVAYDYIFNQVLKTSATIFSIFNFSGILGALLISSVLMRTKKKYDYLEVFQSALWKYILLLFVAFAGVYFLQNKNITLKIFVIVSCLYYFAYSFIGGKNGTVLSAQNSELVHSEKRGRYYALTQLIGQINMALSVLVGGALIDRSLYGYFIFEIAGVVLTLIVLIVLRKKLGKEGNDSIFPKP